MSDSSDAMADNQLGAQPWRVVIVEDEGDIRNSVVEYFDRLVIDNRPIEMVPIESFGEALAEIEGRLVDLLILDVFSGRGLNKADEAGLRILDQIQATGFVCTILYTAHAERVEERRSNFVRLVSKDANGLLGLETEIRSLFGLRLPQMYRGIVTHIDETLRDYMWHFVEENWNDLASISGKPAFLHVLLNRLATALTPDGVERVTDLVFGNGIGRPVAPDTEHPAQLYMMPPLRRGELLMGDIRIREIASEDGNTRIDYLVVLWPSCDMVESSNRTPKTDRAICAVMSRLADAKEVVEMKANPSNNKRRALTSLIENNRAGGADRYHVLPGLCAVPGLLVDFQNIEILPLSEIRALRCVATLASPYAESLSARFGRYIGRLGTPDIDVTFVLEDLGIPPAES